MEPLFGGRLAKIEKEAQDILKKNYSDLSAVELAFKWSASQKNVISILSGMRNCE